MVKLLLALVALAYSTISFSQEYKDGSYIWSGVTAENITSETHPKPSDSMRSNRDQGQIMDFSKGYHVGDSVADFTVYNQTEQEFNMNSILENASISGKYTILFSASNTCSKASDFFNSNSSSNQEAQVFMRDHQEDFNWIMIYGYEAHPIDTENCLSNCSASAKASPAGSGEFQHKTYQERLDAINRWEGVQNGSITIPRTISTYANGSIEPTGEQTQNYQPLNLNIPVYADNPDNLIYDTYFNKPFGVLVIDCAGQVISQGDWLNEWMTEETGNNITGAEFLSSLLNDDEELSCHEWVDYCNADTPDSDQDGLCDEWEAQNKTNSGDICSPYGEDSDFDGLCNLEEKSLGLDPFNPDSDEDLLSDSEEVIIGTDPLDPDSDGDGELDGDEISAGTDPLSFDSSSYVEVVNTDLNFKLMNDVASGKIKLELQAEDNYSISLRSSDGKTILSEYFSSNEYIMDPRDYSIGSYLVSIQDSQGRIKTQRIYIE